LNTIVPLEIYTLVYYYLLFFGIIITGLQAQSVKLGTPGNMGYMKTSGYIFFLFVFLYMGLRPVSGWFGDMVTYANYFNRYQSGEEVVMFKDGLFYTFMKICSDFMSVNTFFFLCAVLYIIPLWVVCKKWFKNYWFYGFLMLVSTLTFWAYGTNGIRNGIASSFFLLALSREKLGYKILWLFLSINFHSSMVLPILAFGLTYFKNSTNLYFKIWLLCIPLSLIGGDSWESFFAGLNLEDKRLNEYLLSNEYDDSFSSTGFRWDFVLYSGLGVFSGWYYIFKRKFIDKVYTRLFNIFLITNAFWILVIRASFSNRFAYLSWFMLGLVIIYPLIKKYFIKDQHKWIGGIMIIYFLFTYSLEVILK